MSLASDLDSLYDLLKDHRTTSALARRADGTPCYVEDPEAVSFCLLGACYKIGGGIATPRVKDLTDSLRKALAKSPSKWTFVLGLFNDNSTLEEVLDVVAMARP